MTPDDFVPPEPEEPFQGGDAPMEPPPGFTSKPPLASDPPAVADAPTGLGADGEMPRAHRRHAPTPIAREMPASEEAEQHVLACCLLDGDETIRKALEAGLTADHFHWPQNQILFQRITALHKSPPVTPETLAQDLRDNRLLDAVGGFAYLMQVARVTPSTAHSAYMIAKVREKHLLREAIKAATGVVERAYTFAGDDIEGFALHAHESIREAVATSSQDYSARAFDGSKTEPEPRAVYSLGGTCIATAGNLVALYSQAKTGKTAVEGAMLAAPMITPGTQAIHDTLGIVSSNPDRGAVIHLDTEQSRYDWQQMVRTALRRAGLDAPPEWLHSFTFTGAAASDIRRAVPALLRKYQRLHGSIHSLHLDGVGDMVTDPNDPKECFPLVTELHGMAIEFNCPVICVLHQNPGSENVKGRGHLGSQLERKAQSNLTMEKSGETTLVWGTKQRGKMITKDRAIAFAWSEEHQMHMLVTPSPAPPKNKGGRPPAYDPQKMLACVPAPNARPVPVNQIHRIVGQMPCSISLRTFKDVLAKWVETGEVERVEDPISGFVFKRRA